MWLLGQLLREPASALTHGLWFLAAAVFSYKMAARAAHPLKRTSVIIYGFTLLFCSGASTLFHAIHAEEATIAWYNRLDHIGIGLLIAGTYTPIAVHLLHRHLGSVVLAAIWLAALASAMLRLTWDEVPKPIATSIYLLMGWGALPGYVMLCRRLPGKQARMIAEGGLMYSLGAIVHWQESPALWPGVFGSHDLFHLFVMAGSYRHFQFIEQAVMPAFYAESLGALCQWSVNPDLASVSEPIVKVVPRPKLWKRRRESQDVLNKIRKS